MISSAQTNSPLIFILRVLLVSILTAGPAGSCLVVPRSSPNLARATLVALLHAQAHLLLHVPTTYCAFLLAAGAVRPLFDMFEALCVTVAVEMGETGTPFCTLALKSVVLGCLKAVTFRASRTLLRPLYPTKHPVV